MSESHAIQIETVADWQMPLSHEVYDQSPTLTQAEQEALTEVTVPRIPGHHLFRPDQPSMKVLARLLQPLHDIYDLRRSNPGGRIPYLHCMCQHMLQANKPFWAWSKEEWLRAISDANSTDKSNRGVMIMTRVTAYLLGGLLIIDDHAFPSHLTRLVFGTTKVAEEYERLAAIIFGTDGFGYVRSVVSETHLRATLMLTMLVNRNPHIDSFTVECLRATKQLLVYPAYQQVLRWITRALVYLKIVKDTALTDIFGGAEPSMWWEYTGSDVDPTWLAWVQAYTTQTNRSNEQHQKAAFYQLLIAGRWLKKYHPEIVSPDQWDEPLGYEYVTWVCHAKKEEFMTEWNRARQDASQAQMPLQANTINSRISTIRQFFNVLQRRPYLVGGQPAQRLVLHWDPNEVLATPENIKRQCVPNPRMLDPAWWQKLTWAAATLNSHDLATRGADRFPLAYYRAIALVWVTGARRANEIRRLKVGCVSREWAPEMRDEDGNQVEPAEDFAFLRIPVSKMRGEFWIPIPSYTADAIEVWERLRPKLQDPQVDRKEHKLTEYLFMMRNQPMGKAFLNKSVIPLLCQVAGLVDEDGVPLHDTVGKITSHRARSTLATWLRSNGLSLTYIAKLLGHTDLKSLPWYLREDKNLFARTIRKHNPLNRIVTAILDTEALKRGAGEPAVFYYLGYGDDGRPHMCASPDYRTCVHQMHCRKCEMYVDAEQAEVIARRPGVFTIEVHIPTPPLVEEALDQEGLGEEITRHLPAPEVPDPAYHLNKNVPPRSSDPELEKMRKELEGLTTEWTEKAGKFDLRSVGMKSLKKRITDLAAKIEVRENKPSPNNVNATTALDTV
jgi:integrase